MATVQHVAPPRPKLVVRKPKLPFDESIPRYWARDNIVGTHLINGINLLFPVGERLFVRSVRRYLDRYSDDPERIAELRAFFGQEGRHAHAHERFFDILRGQGYELDPFLKRFQKALKLLEKVSPDVLSLSSTAAAEHYTAIMASGAFKEVSLFGEMHPVMRDLLLWHAAEEIEHRAVAFDVLRDVDDRYFVRIAGLMMATTTLTVFWTAAVVMLLRQDAVDWKTLLAELRKMNDDDETEGILKGVFLNGIRSYLRRDFHPNDEPVPPEALELIARLDQAPA